MTFGLDQYESRRQSLDFGSDLILALLDLAELLFLIDALTRLSISSQHRLGGRGTRRRQLIFETSRFVCCGAGGFFAVVQIVGDSELDLGNFCKLCFCFFEDNGELAIFSDVDVTQQLP